ncbi:MAG: hypothetical protein EHM43_04200 [Ignavibacteriae bacterium]|nr:MAG: hypothetical protein EHM43_04200 [Ignavibacteriota bacterium]
MRTFTTLLIVSFLCLTVHVSAQSAADSTKVDGMETLIPTGNYTSGGFGGPVIKVGPVDGSTGVFFGARGGWVINRTFVLGGGGYGYTDMNNFSGSATMDTNIAFGYGGLELEYLINANSVVHATVLAHIGAGGFTVYQHSGGGMYGDMDGNSMYSTACFVFEPAVNAEVNILSWLRLTVGAGYRFVTGIDYTNPSGSRRYDNSTVSGLFGVGMLKFGPY